MPKINEGHLRVIRERGMLTSAHMEHPDTSESGQEEFHLFTDDGRGNGNHVFSLKLVDLQVLLENTKLDEEPFECLVREVAKLPMTGETAGIPHDSMVDAWINVARVIVARDKEALR